MRSSLRLIILLSVSLKAYAGAWNVGSFDNDTALDWTSELEESIGKSLLLETLNAVFKTEYKDADVCTNAIAAAEVIASIRDGNLEDLPESVENWVEKHKDIYEPEMAKLAFRAVEECQNMKKSELAQLWDESKSSEWTIETEKLIGRLK